MPNRAVICLGANVPDASERLEAASEFLGAVGVVNKATPKYLTAPEYAGDVAPYLNRVVELHTTVTYETALRMTKDYQTRVRELAQAQPFVAVDIDIVIWNGAVVRQGDAAAAYFRQGLAMLE